MSFTPISNTFIQYSATSSGTSASSYFLKLYAAGTTNPISTALDSAGSTLVAKTELDSLGFAKNGSGGATTLYIDQTYRLVLYINATDADANTFINAVQDIDDIPQQLAAGDFVSLAVLAANTGASLVGYKSTATNSVATTVDERLDHVKRVEDFGAVGDGALTGTAQAGTGTGTDDSAAIQSGLDWLRGNGGTLEFNGSKVYRCDSVLTLLRISSSGPSNYNLQFNGAALDFSNLATGDYLKVGADSLANIATDIGQIIISKPRIFGQQTGNPGSGAAATNTATTGLLLEFAYNVTLDQPIISRCYIGCKTTFVFPLTAIQPSFKRNIIGLFYDDVSNDQTWIRLECPLCRFGTLVQPAGVHDGGKIVNNSFLGYRGEQSQVGMHIDPGTGVVGQGIIRDFNLDYPYMAGSIEFDALRVGSAADTTDASIRGADRTDRVYGLHIRGGNWGSTWTSTHAAVYLASNLNVREMTANLPIEEGNAFGFVNLPRFSQVTFTSRQGSTGDIYRVTQYGAAGEKWTEPQRAIQTMVNVDTTPDVFGHSNFETNTGGPFTITDFDNGEGGQEITVISRAAVTYDAGATNLNMGTGSITTASGDVTKWLSEDGTTWNLLGFVDMSVNNSGGA